MAITLPPLPYEMDALQPYISRETLEYHHEKHHRAYVNNLNQLIVGTPFATKTLEEIIIDSEGKIFNNAAQIWNHTFYFNCLSPSGGGEPKGDLAIAIQQAFGTLDSFKEKFTQTALATFGSGWAWLVQNHQGKLSIISTSNADTPMKSGLTALLTCDVWEHAYYIDYRNLRPDYVVAFWHLVNWDFVAKQYG